MILTCPECATRYQTDAAKFPQSGRNVRCAKCGHVWHQGPPQPEVEDVAAVEAPVEEPAPVYERPEPPVIERAPVHEEPEQEWQVPEPVYAEPAQAVSSNAGGKIGLVVGWVLFIAMIIAIGFAGVTYRQQVATMVPQSASLYSAIGMPVNTIGIDFRNVDYKPENADGQPVIAVTGELVNISGQTVTVPQKIRVGVSDAQKREIYSWTFAPDVLTLQPGQSVPFKTRQANLPVAARNLDLRFAKAGE